MDSEETKLLGRRRSVMGSLQILFFYFSHKCVRINKKKRLANHQLHLHCHKQFSNSISSFHYHYYYYVENQRKTLIYPFALRINILLGVFLSNDENILCQDPALFCTHSFDKSSDFMCHTMNGLNFTFFNEFPSLVMFNTHTHCKNEHLLQIV